MIFELDQIQEARARAFAKEHECPLKEGGVGAIGGRISFRFTPTGLGVIENVECACGKTLCLTEIDTW